jgi:ADP-ribose pyrophosphatase YjhB (NUDIX family)
MSDPRYQYDKINAVKVIVLNDKNEILLIQEPATNEWMPLHWGLPGGKPLIKESILEAFSRKMKEELGQEITPDGIYKIEELLQNDRTVLMFIFVAHLNGKVELQGENNSYKWMSIEEIKQMSTNDFTEYYNQKLLEEYFSGDKQLIQVSRIKSWPYYSFGDKQDYQDWLKSGSKDKTKQ